MEVNKRRPAILAVLVAAMLLTSGTAGVAFAAPTTTDAQEIETPDGEEVIEQFKEQISALETAQFTRTSETTYDNEMTTQTERVVADLDDFQKRVETVDAAVASNMTTVWNESSVVSYDPDANTVSDYETTGNYLLPGIEPLANESMISYEYLGIESVDGQTAYVLEGVPEMLNQADSEVETSVTVYVDSETYFPVQTVTETDGGQYSVSATTTYESVTLDAEIPDETFELDIPDDATDPTQNVGPDISEFDSYETLTAETNLSVPDAALDGFSFDNGAIIEGEKYRSVSLEYTDGEESISVTTRAEQTTGFSYSESDRYEAVEVGDTTGYIHTSDDYVGLHVEGDQSYSIYGETDRKTATDIAASIFDT